MEQHPVPQPITSYEFRLVGDMTLKQFAKLASGLLLALLVYAIDPPGLIKWFLIFLFTILGFGMAFVPFEGRPIDVWIIAFFKRIYSPTQYIWQSKKKEAPAMTKTVARPITPATPPPSRPMITTVAENIFTPAASNAAPAHQPVSSSLADKQVTDKPISIPFTPIKPISKIFPSLKDSYYPYPSPTSRSSKVDPIFTPGVVIPATPTLPNLLVGFVRNKEKRIMGGAILEIRDSEGIPVRAFKTNKLGQFLSATPLPNGEYEIETEKEGYSFDIIKIKLDGKIMPPIEIVSKS